MSVIIKRYQAKDKSTWDNFISNLNRSHFFFQRDFMDYHAERFKDHSLMFYDEDELLGVLPANEKDDVLHSHQGLTFGSFLSNDLGAHKALTCFSELVKHCESQKLKSIVYKAMPNIFGSGLEQQDLYALTYHNFELTRRDISTVVDLRLGINLRKDKKRNYNKGKRLGLQIIEEKNLSTYWGILESILDQYHNTKPTHSLDEIQMLAEKFPHNIVHYLFRDEQGVALGGVVLFIEGNVVHTQYMSVVDAGRKIGALDFLIVSLMEKYQATHQYFSFGISTEDQGKTLNEGLIFQKEGFGGSGVVHDFYKLDMNG